MWLNAVGVARCCWCGLMLKVSLDAVGWGQMFWSVALGFGVELDAMGLALLQGINQIVLLF